MSIRPQTPTRHVSIAPTSRETNLGDDAVDEEAVQLWAVLEKLPTVVRVRTTIQESVASGKKIRRQVDIADVDLREYVRTQLFKHNNPDEDIEIFLAKLRRRVETAGVELPLVEIRYENLSIKGKVHVGSRALPTLLNTVRDFGDMILSMLKMSPMNKRDITLLDNATGIIKPRRMTLLLGPPNSGKTTLLRALSGFVDRNLKVEGSITYNGYNLDEFVIRKTAAYISQQDLHIPELTVRETLHYAARFQGSGSRSGHADTIAEILRKEKEKGILPDFESDLYVKAVGLPTTEIWHKLVTELKLKTMGLDICEDTFVGDEMTRGISGGQRKRLTTGEMIVGPAKALFLDEISTGLDSSTTFKVVKCISQSANFNGSAVLASLLQPEPETFRLFDDIILISGGTIIYHGPRENIEEFFEQCGFRCPPRKTTADFLLEVISKKEQEQFWADKSRPYQFVSVKDFAEAFKRSEDGRKICEALATPPDKSKSHKAALVSDLWLLPRWTIFKIVLQKEILLLRRNYYLWILSVSQLSLACALCSSLFFRTRMHHRNAVDAKMFSGAIFFVVNQVAVFSYSEVVFLTLRLPTFRKFRDLQFFPAWSWALSLFILKIPLSIVESFVAMILTYYIIGFAPAPARFFKFWLLLALGDQMASGTFRVLAVTCKTLAVSASIGGFLIIVSFTLGGYVVTRLDIPGWWIWAYWALPSAHVENAVIVNEFFADRWATPTRNGHILGHQFALSMGLFDRGWYYWLGCGVMVFYTVISYLIFALALTYVAPPDKSRAMLSEETLAEIEAEKDLTGNHPELSLERLNSKSSNTERDPAADSSSTKGKGIVRDESSASNGNDVLRITKSNLQTQAVGRPPKTGMSLPFQPLAISFKDVNYYVDMPEERRLHNGVEEDRVQLLKDITGAFRPGVLTALMGVTGAGKTTLLDVLAGRKNVGYVEGDIRISGFPKEHKTFARISGYCEQNDIHSSQITVHESLIFSAWLRLPREVPSETKMEFIQEVMDIVELTPLKGAQVGVAGHSGLSTEQRKRLTIAVELVANPSIIFMDEPTSGLDARGAAVVMRAVRNTVDTGRTVVCTIHQPSLEIFEVFDELLLLKRGGEIIYSGPLGHHSQKLVKYFQAIQGVPDLKVGDNPAVWMLDVTSPGMEEKLGIDFAHNYTLSEEYKWSTALVAELHTPPPEAKALSFPSKYSQDYWTQFLCCLWKHNRTYWRTPSYNLTRICLSLACSFFFGTVFWGMGHKIGTERVLYSLMGAIFLSQSYYGNLTATAVQPVIHAERVVFQRERMAATYSAIPCALAQCLIEIPYIFLSSCLYGLITYAMIKLDWEAKKVFWYLFFGFCSQLTYSYLGMMIAALTPNPPAGAIITGFLYSVWTLFNGYVLAKPLMPVWWRWAYWVTPLSYTLYGTLVSQFGDLTDVYSTSVLGTRQPVKTLIQVAYGYRHSRLGFIATMSSFWPFLFAVLFILSITFINYQQR